MSNYIPYAVLQPARYDIMAIAHRDTESYNIPPYQHYNWCCEQLGLEDKKVEFPDIKLSRVEWDEVQELMVAACKKYLQENNIEN